MLFAILWIYSNKPRPYLASYNCDELISDPFYLFRITEGGMSFHGGLAGVLIAMWLYGRRLGKTMWQITDFVAPLVPLGLGFGRIGNFINGELWGKPTDVPWAFNINGVGLHPSQLYEAILEGFVLFAILWIYSNKPRPYLAVSGLFLLLYGVFRFFVEFYRVPDAHLNYLALGWVTMGQILSMPMIIVGALIIGYCFVYGWDELISDPLYLFKITEGGMSFHGGLAGVLIAMWIYGRRLGKTMWQITDFVAPLVPLGLGFGRIGNFINGETKSVFSRFAGTG